MGRMKLKRRQRQSVWCCDVNYQRWRWQAHRYEPWPVRGHTHCAKCGNPLAWPEPLVSCQDAVSLAQAGARRSLRAYHRKADRNLDAGLTANGGERQRASYLTRTPTEQRQAERLRQMEKARRRAAAFVAMGLTTRGTPRKNKPKRGLPPREAAWRELRDSMNIVTPHYFSPLEREDIEFAP